MINARWTLENWPWLDEKRRRKERREDKCESRAGTCVRVLMKPRGRWFRGMDTKKKEGEKEGGELTTEEEPSRIKGTTNGWQRKSSRVARKIVSP